MIFGMKKNLGPVPQGIADRIFCAFLMNGLKTPQITLAVGKVTNFKRAKEIEPYYQHAVELCEKNNIRFDEVVLPDHIMNMIEVRGDDDLKKWGRVTGNQKTTEILVSPINSLTDYATVMHEIGHVMDPNQIRYVSDLSPKFLEQTLEAECRKEFGNHPPMLDFLKWGSKRIEDIMNKTNELGAWAWAKQNAKIWTPEMEKFSHKCLATYLERIYKNN